MSAYALARVAGGAAMGAAMKKLMALGLVALLAMWGGRTILHQQRVIGAQDVELREERNRTRRAQTIGEIKVEVAAASSERTAERAAEYAEREAEQLTRRNLASREGGRQKINLDAYYEATDPDPE